MAVAADDAELDEARCGGRKERVGGGVLARKGDGLCERACARAVDGEQVRRDGEARARADAVGEPLEAHDGDRARETERDDAREARDARAVREEDEARLRPLRVLALGAQRQRAHDAPAVRLDHALHVRRPRGRVENELHPVQQRTALLPSRRRRLLWRVGRCDASCCCCCCCTLGWRLCGRAGWHLGLVALGRVKGKPGGGHEGAPEHAREEPVDVEQRWRWRGCTVALAGEHSVVVDARALSLRRGGRGRLVDDGDERGVVRVTRLHGERAAAQPHEALDGLQRAPCRVVAAHEPRAVARHEPEPCTVRATAVRDHEQRVLVVVVEHGRGCERLRRTEGRRAGDGDAEEVRLEREARARAVAVRDPLLVDDGHAAREAEHAGRAETRGAARGRRARDVERARRLRVPRRALGVRGERADAAAALHHAADHARDVGTRAHHDAHARKHRACRC